MARRKREDEACDFAVSVVDLVRRRRPSDTQLVAADTLEVRRVANGLALIFELLERAAADTAVRIAADTAAGISNPAAGTSNGLVEAFAIMESLTTGKDHPVQHFITGLRSDKFRENRPAPVGMDVKVRAIMVAAARAMQDYGGIRSEIEAMSRVARAASSDNGARVTTADSIKGWKRHSAVDSLAVAQMHERIVKLASKHASKVPRTDYPRDEAVLDRAGPGNLHRAIGGISA